MCSYFNIDFAGWEAPGLGQYFFFMILETFVFTAVLLAIEYNLFRACISRLKGKKAALLASNDDCNEVHILFARYVPALLPITPSRPIAVLSHDPRRMSSLV